MSKKHTAQFHVKRLIESISELANTHHIPCAVTLYRKSTPEIHGSPNLKEAIASQVTNNSQFMSSMKRDLRDLRTASEDIELVETHSLKNKKPPPFPIQWDLLNQNHTRSYIGKCILTSYWKNNGQKKQLKFYATGGNEFKPEWWLQHLFPWEDFTNPAHELNYPGPEDFHSFCKRSIEACFTFHGWQVKDWPHMKVSTKKLVDIKRAKGIRGLRYDEDEDINNYHEMEDSDNEEDTRNKDNATEEVVQDEVVKEEVEDGEEAGDEQDVDAVVDQVHEGTGREDGEVEDFSEDGIIQAEFDLSFTQRNDEPSPSQARRRRDSDINNDRAAKRSRLPDQSSPALTRSKSRDI